MPHASRSTRLQNILLVDDSENDRILLHEALRGVEPGLGVHQVCDGDECLSFLRREAPHHQAPSVDLVLLDLHLRRMDGSQVLAALRDDPALRHLPVVVLSTSASALEIKAVYQLGCRAYMVKPPGFLEMKRRLSVFVAYWSEIVQRPTA